MKDPPNSKQTVFQILNQGRKKAQKFSDGLHDRIVRTHISTYKAANMSSYVEEKINPIQNRISNNVSFKLNTKL